MTSSAGHATDEPLRIGLLGASRIAPPAVLAPARALGHRVVVVAARDRRRAEAYAAEHGIERVADSYDDVLSDGEVDVVYNPLANSMHGPWNLAAVAAGRHVLSEKPFTSNAEEAREVRAAAIDAGVVVMEAFHYLYHPLVLRLDELLDGGELGELRGVEIDMVMPPPKENDPRWSFELAGGSMMDVGCYGIHLARHLGRWAGGEPRVVSAEAQEHPEGSGVDGSLTVQLEYPGGIRATVRSGMTSPELRFAFRLVGARGEVSAPAFVKPQQDDRLLVTVGGEQRVEHVGTRPTYEYQLEAFAAHVREGRPLRNDMDDAVAQMELIDECYRAAGLPVRPRASAPTP